MNFDDAQTRANILKALAHPIRIMLVDALDQGDKCVSELCALADVDPSNISRHLAQLKRAGIVSERKEGQRVVHHLACPCILRAFDCTLEVIEKDHARRSAVLKRIKA